MSLGNLTNLDSLTIIAPEITRKYSKENPTYLTQKKI